jgi:two-component system phosphate regulon sensor histidine kinase PhoR
VTRLFPLLFCILVCAGIVGLIRETPVSMNLGAFIGGALGLLCWFSWDNWRASLLLAWLRRLQDARDAPLPAQVSGIWRRVAERMERLLRQQRRQENILSRNLDNLKDALHATPNGVIMLDGAGRIKWLNRIACQHFGLDEKRDIAQTITHLLRDPVFIAYYAERDFTRDITLDSPLATATCPLRLSVHIYPYSKKRLLIFSRDITAIEQAETMRRDFVANVSHELRSPLTVLAGFIETLQTLPLAEDERRDYLERMARHAERMQNLICDLLALSRLEASPPPAPDDWTPVRTLLVACATEARALSAIVTRSREENGHVFIFPTEAEQEAEIAGNTNELQSAFNNLVSNAIRYTPPGGRIVIRWTPTQEGGATFTVQDSGPGIAPEHIPRLTERFYRVDTSRSQESGGTGLGLSIVKHVLQRHGARLEIESPPGEGACFTAIFPATRVRWR